MWRKSSFSQGGTNDCVELAVGGERTLVRDTKARGEGSLTFRAPAFEAFVRALKGG
jgi:hypothetical protein